jgi:hypothetical protein
MPRFTWLSLLLVSAAWLAGCSCGNPSGPRQEIGSEACRNGLDDDGDGQSDCEDPGCDTATICALYDGGGPRTDAGPGTDIGPVDAREVTCVDPIDLVFVLDVSTSMSGEAMALRTGVASIFTAADALTTDHHFGLVVFVDDALVVNDCDPFTTPSALAMELMDWQTFCSTNRSPANGAVPNMDCQENSLDAMYAAATQCTWRAGATHILIHVTDDTFEERPYVYSEDIFGGGGIAALRTYSETRDALLANEIRVGAFAMLEPEPCGAGTSGNTARGFLEPYGVFDSFPVLTGGRAWNLREVRDGTLDMSTAISEMIEDEHCTVF